jgi:flagellar biosynthesis anti-sigma factor FlgM
MQVSRNGVPSEAALAPSTSLPGQAQETRGLSGAGQPGAGQPTVAESSFLPREDTATLSPAASSAANLIAQAMAGDVAQPAKVVQITAAIADGSYKVDADQLASTLIVTMLNGADRAAA